MQLLAGCDGRARNNDKLAALSVEAVLVRRCRRVVQQVEEGSEALDEPVASAAAAAAAAAALGRRQRRQRQRDAARPHCRQRPAVALVVEAQAARKQRAARAAIVVLAATAALKRGAQRGTVLGGLRAHGERDGVQARSAQRLDLVVRPREGQVVGRWQQRDVGGPLALAARAGHVTRVQ